MDNYRSLILRSSRALGSKLTEMKLVDPADLEKANRLLLESIQNEDYKNANLIKFLCYELDVLEENTLLSQATFPLISLQNFDIPHPKQLGLDIGLCYSSWTIPFEREGDYYLLATSFSLSEPILEFWNDHLNNKTIWYSTDLASIVTAFDQIEEKEESLELEEAGA